MSSKQKNLLKEIKNYNQDSENNKIDLKIKRYNDNQKENESEYEEEEEEEEEDDDEKKEEDDDNEEKEEKEEKEERKEKEENERKEEKEVKEIKEEKAINEENEVEEIMKEEKDKKEEDIIEIDKKEEDKIEENLDIKIIRNQNIKENNSKEEKKNDIINKYENLNNNIDEAMKVNDIKSKENTNNIGDDKEKQKAKPPIITKFKIIKSASTSNFELNKNNGQIPFNFQAEEIRTSDIYEKKKMNKVENKKKKICYKCGIEEFNEKTSITFSCSHFSCLKCIIKDLILLQFKNIENKDKIKLNCRCLMGVSPIIEFSDLSEKIKDMNDKKVEKQKCKEHEYEGIKYCQDCELWLCEDCINIHSIFNKGHSLIEIGIPLKNKCKIHTKEFTQYFCLKCKEEICPFCLTINGNHREHKSIKFDKFLNLKEEIKSKMIFPTYEDFVKNLEDIREKCNLEKIKKIEKFKEIINNLINKIKIKHDDYIKKINDKIEYLNKAVDLMKNCYKYFYILLSSEKRDFNDLNFLRQITEILDIKTRYYTHKDISNVEKIIENFNSNDLISYSIENINSLNNFSFNFKKIFRNKIFNNNVNLKSMIVQSKYNFNPLKYKEIKYEKSIKTYLGAINAFSKINNNQFSVSCGKEILIINYDNNNNNKSDSNQIYSISSLGSHSKNILCLTLLLENKLASGGEDKLIKIWDIQNKKCIDTISKNFERISSLLSFDKNKLIIGTHNFIKIINIETKEEISTLIGHEKSICSIIKINENKIASCSYDNTIKIWNIYNIESEYTLYGHDSPVFSILLLKDGRLISGSGSWNKSLRIWNLEKKNCEFNLIGHKREVRDIKQLSNGWIISASMDKTIKVWNINKKICIQTLVSHYDIILSLCIIDKNKFVSGGRDQDIIIWKY